MPWRRCWCGRATRRRPAQVLNEAEGSGEAATQLNAITPPPAGHGRNGAEAFGGAQKVEIAHQNLKHGNCCPECGEGNVYGQKEPKVLVRIVGQAPVAATVYSLERLRCGACGQVFTAQEPEGVGPEKYDETAAAMIAQLKYGSGSHSTGWNSWKVSSGFRCQRQPSGRLRKSLWSCSNRRAMS
jgi:rubredoxin